MKVQRVMEAAETQGDAECAEHLCVVRVHRSGLFTEMRNSECMSDRDYQGWVDFGRRDAE